MNPIIYFDELDKISQTNRGEEITNILVHLTDPIQNSHFRDKYFHGVDIDLSKATFIFSFNNPKNVNPILLDRITCIETKYLLLSHKINIVNNYLLPDMLKDINFDKDDIHIDNDNIKYLINKYTLEGGIRKLKSLLYNIIREINIELLTNPDIQKPYYITNTIIDNFLHNKYEYVPDKINTTPKVGIVYGLYAGCSGVGGVLPIQAVWVPSNNALTLKTTGYLERVIKESTEVANSLAWNSISQELKDKYLLEWKEKPLGFHIHCPDGAQPKDGPSAGAALTLVLYSLLTNLKIDNYIAMTGEINLEGNITAIGGLEEKLEGAKRVGIKKVLIPEENRKDLVKIMKRNKTLLDNNFKVKIVSHFNDVIKEAIIN
jgi:ATP-dependent Lon protease